MSNISTWSTAAASNTSSAPDGFPEGMAPSGLNDAAREVMAAVRRWYDDAEWINPGWTPTYVSASTFTLTGDKTARFHVGRRVKALDGSSTLYGTIHSATYTGAASTGVYVTLDSGNFTASLSAISVGILSFDNKSTYTSTLTASTIVSLSSVITDTISERSSGAGVTIDTCLIKDGGAAAVSDGTNIIKTKIVDIGDWNMNASAGGLDHVHVTHGLTASKIRGVSAYIRDDLDASYQPIWYDTNGALRPLISWSPAGTDIELYGGPAYDNASYNTASSFNRGYVIITYVV